MAKIYQKLPADKTLIIEPRQGFMRSMNLTGSWQEIRIGMFFSQITGSDDNAAGSDAWDDVPINNNNTNRIFFGIRTSGSTVPGNDSSYFLGAYTTGSSSRRYTDAFVIPYHTAMASPSGKLSAVGYSGSTRIGGTTETNNSSILGPFQGAESPALTTNYCGFYGLRFVINNRGLSTQTVSVWFMKPSYGTHMGSDYSTGSLKTLLNSLPNSGSMGTIDWNNGTTAYPIPDHFYLYLPFTQWRMRLSAIYAAEYTYTSIPLTYSSDGDTNGLFYYIGTHNPVAAFSNPSPGKVTHSSSNVIGGSVNNVTDRVGSTDLNTNGTGNWIKVDLGDGRSIIPNKYTLRQPNATGFTFRNWKLQGSNNNSTWTDIKVHSNDTTLSTVALSYASWDLTGSTAYRYLRLLSTGVNSSGNDEMYLGDWEFYGTYITNR